MSEHRGEDLPEEVPIGYAWDFETQQRRLPKEEYDLHRAILDDLEEEDLDGLDLSRASDYVLWAAAQAFEELERGGDAVACLKRIAASASPHPALSYPDILLRLEELLKDRGDYDEALAVLARVEQEDAALKDACREERASVLVLSGRIEEGVRLFEAAAREAPEDPWVLLIAAWALLQRGRYEEALSWVGRAEQALRWVEDREEALKAREEIAKLRKESAARLERRRRLIDAGSPGAPPGLGSAREEMLARLDAEEVRLVEHPPRDAMALSRATERLAGLQQRASRAWDDAVEAGDEEAIAAFDDLMAEIASLAERFGIELADLTSGAPAPGR